MLYKAVFKMQSIFLTTHNGVAKVADVAHKNIGASHGVYAVEVATHPAMQVLSLSHINHRTLLVVVEIYARRIGQ